MWRIAIAFLLGHCCIYSLAALPAPAWGIALLAAFGIAALVREPLLAAFLIGLAWAWFNGAARLADDLPTALEGQDLLVRGYVASLPDSALTDPQFLFDTFDVESGVPSRIRLTWYRSSTQPQPGEAWQLVVRLKRRNGFANPGGFDYEGYLFREGIGASGYVRADERNLRLKPASHRYPITQLRAWIARRMSDALEDDRMLGVLQGLAVGDTQAMSAEQWRVFAATGTTHLMAISGLHISMVAALAAWLGGLIVRWRGAQARGWTAIHGQVLAGFAAAVFYSFLAGLSVPTQRTLIMLCIYFAARWWRRELSVGHAFGLALIGVLIVDPFAPLAVGAWLSFGAVAIIMLAVSGRLVRDGPVKNFTRIQAAITIGLTPLLLGAFGNLSIVSPFANALAVPLFTLIVVPAVLLGALVSSVSVSAGGVLLALPSWLLDAVWPLFDWAASQPLSVWHCPRPSALASIALVAGVLLLVLPGIWPTRIAGVLLCLPAFMSRPPAPAAGDFEFALLDVGQGLSAVVRTQSHVLVYDTGPAFQTGRDTGELVVLPYLRERGVRRVDTLVISHGDLDHRGGMHSIIEGMPVERIVAGPSVQEAPARTIRCRRGQRWMWDGVEFDMLHPVNLTYERDNDSSCVLRVRGRAGSVLLTGDIEADAESALVNAGLGSADVVIGPHHGSRTSSTAAFVHASRPRLALFPAGYRNRWGLPKEDVVSRWSETGARTFTTADSGAIEISFDSRQPLLAREYRRTHRRYWQR